jgi:Transposase DNA-binding/Transposase Tn5 dimerisation domain
MWSTLELRHVDLGDQRLNKRLVKLVDDLLNAPEASVPQASGDWAATKAAYRFWDNPRVDPDDIRAAHRHSTLLRLPGSHDEVLLAIQDTTSFDFTGHPDTTGLGYLAHSKRSGFWLHSVLAVTATGVPLGLIDQRTWTRDRATLGKRALRNEKETADKESQRWLDALTATEAALPAEKTILTVADREADFYDLFAQPRRPGSHLLIRAKPRRRVRHVERLLGASVRAHPAAGTIVVELKRGDDRPPRQATLTIRFATLDVAPPSTHPRRKSLPDLRITAILAEEENPPQGQKPVRWWLVTTLPITTLADAEQAVRWYTLRWLIERYHYVLKSGCRIENLQLETAARLDRAVATYAVVAWRLLWLTYEARRHPEASCEGVLPREHWQVLHQVVQKTDQTPASAPSLRAAVRQIARLGGFLARKGDGEPGVKTIWRGLRRLEDLLTGWKLSLKNPAYRVVGNA